MTRYIIKRIGLLLVTSFIILSLTFILMKLLPMDRPLGLAPDQLRYYQEQVRLGYMIKSTVAVSGPGTATVNDSGVFHYYVQVPVMQQYFNWLTNVITRWDWGVSSNLYRNSSAVEILALKLPVTIRLNVVALLISVPLGFLFGIVAALNKNRPIDHVISTGVMIFISIPSFVFITFLMLFFAYNLNWLPSQWPAISSGMGLEYQIRGYIIPVAALSFGTIAGFTRYTRAELTEIMSSDFLLLARTKGLTKSQTVLRHALRNSLVPIVPMIIGQFIGILSGSMVLEQLYGIPGIGQLFVQALNAKDYNIVMVDMAIFTTIGLFAGLLVDLSYGIVDPRIRMGARK